MKLKPPQKVSPEGGRRVRSAVPPLPAWEPVPGQLAMDLGSDDPDALIDPAAEGRGAAQEPKERT
jgi:hypothetical protein